ncbi:gamma-glutamylcyclotransferase [Bradyrhizobium sp. BRP22]|uniref:gamma-glutamylcyclotransferase family protein n=1 Tax=Bradyrhizobium sp. BRP22 TaxID=2793821 RepID=UPI001CD5DB9C|nr:gamma-glutamylcyclotransferase family protein [Bradyrhizobium sp. BRP22]MCA1452853.1 gamma-glutamylcyclotransferase [Bradyrhizobium sp. BRP22]
MTTFTKLWVLKSPVQVAAGTVLTVSLKGGRTKEVPVGQFIGQRGANYLYLPAAQADDADAEAGVRSEPMLYFAYGSNLNKKQMARRCPAAVPLGKLIMPNTQLVFRGVADVIRADGVECPGGIWRITPECEAALDRYEGFDPDYPDRGMYTKEYVRVAGLPDGATEIMLYVMNSSGIYPPSEYYFDVIRQGYRDFGLDTAALRMALKHSHDEKRPTHVERKRTRRMGRPALAPRPAGKPVQSKAERKADKKAARKADRKADKTARQMYRDPQADLTPEQRRRKITNLTEWLRDRRNNGIKH